MTKLYSIEIINRDGGRWASPGDSIEAGLLNGMVEAQREATRTNRGSIAWSEVTDRFVKGHFVNTGERVLVRWSDLPFAVNEELDAWVDAQEVAV